MQKTHRPTWVPKTARQHPSGEAFHLSLPSWAGLGSMAKALTRFHRAFPVVPRRRCGRGMRVKRTPNKKVGKGKVREGSGRVWETQDKVTTLLCLNRPLSSSPASVKGCVSTSSAHGSHSEELRARSKRKQLALCRFYLPRRGPRVPVDSKKRRKY